MRIPILGKVMAASALAGLLSIVPLHPRGPLQSRGPLQRRGIAEQEPAPGGSQPSTSQQDQIELSVTVYNSNLALVRDVRDVTLPAGTFQLKFMDIAASVNPATVHFRSLNDPTGLSVLEQNYEYDLLDPAKLLAKYIGREVTLMRARQVDGTTEWEDIKATLIANNNGPVCEDRKRDRHRLPSIEHSLPGTAGKPL